MNKKVLGIIGIIVVIILLIICCTINTEKEEPTSVIENATIEAASVKENEKKDFIEINMDEYLNIYNGEEKKVVVIARPTCHYCQIAEPILQYIGYRTDLDIYYLNTDNFQEGDSQRLRESDEFFSGGFGTPILLILGNGKIHDKVDGLTDLTHYVEFLRENKFIN